MASTRNRNTPGNYKLEKDMNINQCKFNTYEPYGTPKISYHPGDGLMPAKTSRDILASNACDVESNLFGIGSTNLEKPMPNFNPQLKEIKSLSVIDKPTVFVVEPRAIDDKQRPYILN